MTLRSKRCFRANSVSGHPDALGFVEVEYRCISVEMSSHVLNLKLKLVLSPIISSLARFSASFCERRLAQLPYTLNAKCSKK